MSALKDEMADRQLLSTNRHPSYVDSDELAEALQKLQLCTTFSKTMEKDLSNPPTPEGKNLLPTNFGVVAPGIYRSSYPQFPHFNAMELLELKTIITFVPETLPFEYANFISSNGIIHHHIHIKANKDPEVYTDAAVVSEVMELLLEKDNYPILIHCNKGKHRTGCMSACFRKVTGWTTEACIAEYEHYSKPKDRMLDKVFIDNFDASSLKPVAFQREMVGGVYAMGMNHSTNESIRSSEYTVQTTETVETAVSVEEMQANAFSRRDVTGMVIGRDF